MKTVWNRYEGPTWVVAFVMYGAWLGLATLHRQLAPWILVPAAVYVTAWQSSVAHETIHAMRRVPRPLRTALAFPPLGVWFPFELYRREHLRHHAVRDLTGPDDPETFYFEPAAWSALWPGLRVLYRANQSLAGRLVIGPALLIGRTYARETGLIRAGDRTTMRLWVRHLGAIAVLFWFLGVVAGLNPLLYVAVIAYPAMSLGLLRSFAEHRAAENENDRTATVVSSGVLSLLFLNNNFHAAHHQNPTLPWYALPAYWRALGATGGSSGPTYERGYVEIVRSWLWRPLGSPVRANPRADARNVRRYGETRVVNGRTSDRHL